MPQGRTRLAGRRREVRVGQCQVCRAFWPIDPKAGKEPRCPVCQRPLQPLDPAEKAPPQESITDQTRGIGRTPGQSGAPPRSVHS